MVRDHEKDVIDVRVEDTKCDDGKRACGYYGSRIADRGFMKVHKWISGIHHTIVQTTRH